MPQGAVKLQAVKLFSFFFSFVIFSYEEMQPLEAHGQVVPFLKPPISHCLEPGGHGGGRTFRAQNP